MTRRQEHLMTGVACLILGIADQPHERGSAVCMAAGVVNLFIGVVRK